MSDRKLECSDCSSAPDLATTRRGFLAAGAALIAAPSVWSGTEGKKTAESYVGELFESLSGDLKKAVCLANNNALRKKVSANWAITEPKIESFSPKQKELVDKIIRGASSPEGYEKFKVQMKEDSGGIGDYHVAFFGKPGDKDFEFVMSGRHVTMRIDGNHKAGPAFGGPMVYGHQGPTGDPEAPDHKGNVFWYQALRANEVFKALDTEQRKIALVQKAPAESSIKLRKSGYPGLNVGKMSADQKQLVKAVMSDVLSPYRKADVDEVMEILTANGGIDKINLAFYQTDSGGANADLGNDKVWDIWRLEGPGFVWHFRGAPHVHTWVNIDRV